MTPDPIPGAEAAADLARRIAAARQAAADNPARRDDADQQE